MKRVIVIILAIITGMTECCAQNVKNSIPAGIYYLVRHAEKDTGKNPVLTAAGYERSGDLYRALKKKQISKIYVSQFRRTQLTADSLRIYQKADTFHYVADATGDDVIKKITLQNGHRENVLIIGHSNTVPGIIKKLGITDFYPNELPDHEYDNLYMITIKKSRVTLKKLKYGKPSVAPVVPVKMKPLQ